LRFVRSVQVEQRECVVVDRLDIVGLDALGLLERFESLGKLAVPSRPSRDSRATRRSPGLLEWLKLFRSTRSRVRDDCLCGAVDPQRIASGSGRSLTTASASSAFCSGSNPLPLELKGCFGHAGLPRSEDLLGLKSWLFSPCFRCWKWNCRGVDVALRAC
jgi:hypothetical protein